MGKSQVNPTQGIQVRWVQVVFGYFEISSGICSGWHIYFKWQDIKWEGLLLLEMRIVTQRIQLLYRGTPSIFGSQVQYWILSLVNMVSFLAKRWVMCVLCILQWVMACAPLLTRIQLYLALIRLQDAFYLSACRIWLSVISSGQQPNTSTCIWVKCMSNSADVFF